MNSIQPQTTRQPQPIIPQNHDEKFLDFSNFIVENHEKMSTESFADKFRQIQTHYLKARQRDLFCSEAEILADKLIQQKNPDFAGIIMSSLCKITEYFPEQLESFAKKGYSIAKENGDYIHMMARLNDLSKVYWGRYDRFRDYLRVLFKQEKCLKVLYNDYDNAVNSYRTINRQAADRQDYGRKLAFVRMEIAKLIKNRQPKEAQDRLYAAENFFNQIREFQPLDYINSLINKIKTYFNQPYRYMKIDNTVSRSAQPRKQDFEYLKSQGVTDVINFRTMYVPDVDFDEKTLVESMGMKYHNIPSITKKPTEDNIWKFLEIVEGVKEKKGKVHIHCKAGADRTGMYSLIYKQYNNIGDLASNIKEMLNMGHNKKLYPSLIPWIKKFLG